MREWEMLEYRVAHHQAEAERFLKSQELRALARKAPEPVLAARTQQILPQIQPQATCCAAG